MPNSSPAIPSVCNSSSAATLIFFNSHGTTSRPAMPAITTKAPRFSSVSTTEVPPLFSSCTIEFRIVSSTTATTSSNTATPIASCPARSWFAPVSCSTLLMIADEETISIAASTKPSVAFHPIEPASPREKR